MQTKKKSVFTKLANMVPVLREVREIRTEVRQLRRDLQGGLAMQRMALFQHLMETGLRDHPRFSDPKRLLSHSFRVNSQNGEDGILREVFRRIGTTNRVFLEIGIGDGIENNTAFLSTQGWTGFWIDGNKDFPAKAQAHGLDKQIGLLSSFVTRENVDGLLRQLKVPTEFDLFSLDVDYNTYYIWEALAAYRPRVVVVEYNAGVPADLDWKVRYDGNAMWDGSWNFGASLKAYELLGAKLGYNLVGCDFHGNNAFFVRSDLTTDKFASPFTAENHFEPSRLALFYHTTAKRGWLDRAQ